jgi:hypothetical protein
VVSRIVRAVWAGKPASICLALWFAVGSARAVFLANSSKNWRRRFCGIIGPSAGAKRVIRSLTCLDTKRCPLSVQQTPIA